MKEIPYRIDLAGGWLDQPYVSKHYPGPVIVFSIEPTHDFDLRSGMATSTREKAKQLWNKENFPTDEFEKWAEVLFKYDSHLDEFLKNGFVSGSQDAYGIMLPGINKLNYNGEYLPSGIESLGNSHSDWLESKIRLVRLGSREKGYDVLADTNINPENAKSLSDAANAAWDAIINEDAKGLGKAVRESFEAQVKMFPNMVNDYVMETIEKYKDKAYGWKLSGAGGGGYLTLVSDKEIPESLKIEIRKDPNL